MWGGGIVKVTSVKKCDFTYPDAQRSLRGRRLALYRKINPEFNRDDITCVEMKPHEVGRLVNRLNRKLERQGIKCAVMPDTNKIEIARCRLTDKYVNKYGYNLSPRSEFSYGKQRRGKILGWYDWIDFNIAINDVMDDLKISANVDSRDTYGGHFVIRRGLDSASPSDWDDLEWENIGHQDNPLFRPDLWKSEGKGRVGFWKDEAKKRLAVLKRQKVVLPPNITPEQLVPMLKEVEYD